MTEQHEREAFEAWYNNAILPSSPCHKYYTKEALEWAFQAGAKAARANSGWLQDAVIVLEEGAEPMAGDLCYDYTGVLYRAESRNFNECYEIIQRNGKPVVYKPKGEK